MTEDTTQQLNGVHRRQRRVRWQAIVLAAVAAALLAFTVGTFVQAGQEQEQQTTEAVSAAEQLCAQVETLGGLCVVDPDDLRGEAGPAGPPGPPGPPPSDEQVAAAVAAYLAANPPERGRPPTMREIADAVAVQLAANPPERGPGPTREQILAAVTDFLISNPPPSGPPGLAGEDGQDGEDSTVPGPAGPPGPTCPEGTTLREREMPLQGETWFVCVEDEESEGP